MKTSKTTAKSGAATSKSKAKSMEKPAAKKTSDVLAPTEDLSGTIALVDVGKRELTLVGSNGVPYDFALTRKTQVELGGKNMRVQALAGEIHKRARVHFLPTAHGNLAETIRISTS